MIELTILSIVMFGCIANMISKMIFDAIASIIKTWLSHVNVPDGANIDIDYDIEYKD